MPNIAANGIRIEYESFGNPRDPALLLIMGFRAQLISWDEAFCEQLAGKGFHVLRFDNRDVGLSTKLDHAPQPDLGAAFQGDFSSAAYGLEDMAKDAVGLLDALELKAAHIVGASMGGMIAQLVAIHHPERTLSLCSIMSTTGDRVAGQPHPGAMSVLLAPMPPDREAIITQAVAGWRVIGSTGFPFDEAGLRKRLERAYDRCWHPAGAARQFLAILAARDRTPALAEVKAPTVVIHGAVDPLVDPSGGEATARAIPGARLVMIPGMGHDLPEGAWPTILGSIAENARRAAQA